MSYSLRTKLKHLAYERDITVKECERLIKALDLVDTAEEIKIGHWTRELIRNEKGGCIGAKMICSECGNDNKHDEYMTYCPNCGAKMNIQKINEILDKHIGKE